MPVDDRREVAGEGGYFESTIDDLVIDDLSVLVDIRFDKINGAVWRKTCGLAAYRTESAPLVSRPTTLKIPVHGLMTK